MEICFDLRRLRQSIEYLRAWRPSFELGIPMLKLTRQKRVRQVN